MPDIRFETGLVNYKLNDKCQVSFNPTDSTFVEKLYRTFESLDRKQEAYEAEIKAAPDPGKVFDIAHARDAEMRTMIDNIFGKSVCDELFGTVNVYAMADGLPIWSNLLLAIMDEVNSTFATEQKKMSPRLQKYLDKYKEK